MTTSFLGLVDVVVTALSGAPALAGGNIRRGRAVPVATGVSSAIAVNLLRSEATQLDFAGQALQWQTLVQIRLYGRAAAGADGETTIDTLLESVWARLLAITPPAGVFGIALDPGVAWDVDEADYTLIEAQLVLRITHVTTGGALAA